MITTKLMLDSLHTWVIVHQTALSDYLHQYPYSNYLAIDANNALRHKICEIITYIISLIAPQHHKQIGSHYLSPSPILSYAQTNALCKIKTLLDDLKVSFLTVGSIKRINTTQILSTLQQAIKMTSIPYQKKIQKIPKDMTRNRSFDQIERRQRPKSNFMRRYQEQITKKTTQTQRTEDIKNELYRQMSYDLSTKSPKYQKIRQQKTSPKRQTSQTINLKYKYEISNPQTNKHKYFQQQPRQSYKQKHQKRLFKYLEEDLEDRRKRRQEKEVNQFLYQTPKEEKYRTLPTTQSTRNKYRKEQSLEEYLPSYQLDQNKLDFMKKQLDKRLKFSKIQYTDEEEDDNQENVWQQFEKDSTQNQNTVLNNLEDSLQLMKQEQALNKTGQFNPIPITIANQLHQYSFSND